MSFEKVMDCLYMMRWRCLHCKSRKGFAEGGIAWAEGQSGRVPLRHPYAHAYAVLTRISGSNVRNWDLLLSSLLSTCFMSCVWIIGLKYYWRISYACAHVMVLSHLQPLARAAIALLLLFLHLSFHSPELEP